MAKFVLAYTGGSMAETPEAQEAAMQAWGAWFGTLGAAIVDPGNPFGASNRVTSASAEGATSTGLGGYSIIEAADISAASKLAGGCPVLTGGGAVEVFEAMPM
jgi:hypothetical protein